MSKLWTTSRKYKEWRRHTWWRGRNKLLVAYVPDGHGYSNTTPIIDDADRIWYMIADPQPRFFIHLQHQLRVGKVTIR